jgi:probable rRNA maturation factor
LHRIRKDLALALCLLGFEDAELSLLFVGSREMKALNMQYRGIPKETDVLSFPMDNKYGPPSSGCLFPDSQTLAAPDLLGDIAVSIPKTIEQAEEYGTSFYTELLRLLVHGLLHLSGYDHEIDRREKLRMEKKEVELLNALQGLA